MDSREKFCREIELTMDELLAAVRRTLRSKEHMWGQPGGGVFFSSRELIELRGQFVAAIKTCHDDVHGKFADLIAMG